MSAAGLTLSPSARRMKIRCWPDLPEAAFSNLLDGCITWKPVFDNNFELAVGDIEYDPQNANIVYAGTGDPNMPSIVYNGNGLYKSIDAGETWQYSGLDQAGIVAKVVVDPVNSQNLYVATMGNPYVRDNNRGVYKSTDGGAT
ncbi:MAG: hypothetical protein R3E60_00675 [Alphaproteobacteria bacterium]